eukprot:TRINITY_DN5490_c0_g1_i1.p2 TRINITY_DN5490_c0_g1~~TRINITY_DN5490_c0_g1_i1.p2  ORF type:complete len:110 (+),score=11.90 TRINITY_DN5490_c0_g1_i1:511-840(+)
MLRSGKKINFVWRDRFGNTGWDYANKRVKSVLLLYGDPIMVAEAGWYVGTTFTNSHGFKLEKLRRDLNLRNEYTNNFLLKAYDGSVDKVMAAWEKIIVPTCHPRTRYSR